MSAKKPGPRKNGVYPFSGTLDVGGKKERIEIIRLAQNGLLAHLKSTVFVGKHYQCTFDVPGTSQTVQTDTKVIKTADRSVDKKQLTIDRLIEIHFINLPPAAKNAITSFLAQVGQK